MKILFVSAEVAPYAKVGGLADVAGSLPSALRGLGHDVRTAMPAYPMVMGNPAYAPALEARFRVALNPLWSEEATVHSLDDNVWLLGSERWFAESTASERLYVGAVEPYLFFQKAVIGACEAMGWMPDLVHCNDWHTGLIPLLMSRKTGWEAVSSVFTVHNLAYQGEFSPDVLGQLDLPADLFDMHKLEAYGSINFLKGGCVFSDLVNTVSPTYAEEIQTPRYGCRLEGLMAHLAAAGRLRGILNGIPVDVFDPASDPHIPAAFSAADLSGKAICRSHVLAELELEAPEDVPLLAIVSRLSPQKGIDVLIEAAARILELPSVLVVLGLGDPELAGGLAAVESRFSGKARYIGRFDDELAHRIYAGSDIFLMPSRFEPCGLGQLIAFRYGTIPVARRTGGLADTVREPLNGFVFDDLNPDELTAAISRAAKAFRSPAWPDLVARAMLEDHSWAASALLYDACYRDAVARRTAEPVPAR